MYYIEGRQDLRILPPRLNLKYPYLSLIVVENLALSK